MHITAVRAVPVRVPRNKVLYAAGGTLRESEFGIVFVDTDEGIQGLGEISMNLGRAGISLSHDVNTLLAPALVGKNPLNVQRLIRLMDLTLDGSEAAHYAEKGFRHIKLKVGRPGTGEDLAAVRAVRHTVGEAARIRIDANAAYTGAGEAVKEIRSMERCDLELVEQPVPAKYRDALAWIRRKIDTPLMADESMYHWADTIELVKKEAADVLSIYISECGGLLGAQKAFAIAEAAGMPALIGSQCEMGMATAAQLHLAVAMPNLAYSSDLAGPLRHPYTLINEPFEYVNGTLAPFERPGSPGHGASVRPVVASRI